MKQNTSTQEKILEAGKHEFLSKGFLAASLRNIVKEAGVTTGAFYGYFSSKEALFTALVEPHAAAVMGKFMAAQDAFSGLSESEQPGHVGRESADCVQWMVDYIYRNYDAFKLLICRAQGTAYEHFIHNMVEIEVAAADRYLRSCGGWGDRSRSWTSSSHISSPAACFTVSLRSWFTICPVNRPDAALCSSRSSIWQDGKK